MNETDPIPPRRPRRGPLITAWVVISLATAVAFSLQFLPQDASLLDAQDRVGRIMLRLQGRYIVGAVELTGAREKSWKEARALEVGSLAQRQRFIPLAAELAGPREAGVALMRLDHEIEQERRSPDSSLDWTQADADVQVALRALYLDGGRPVAPANEEDWDPVERMGELPESTRETFREQLGWFARLALAPPGSDGPAREAVLSDARRVLFVLLGVFAVLAAAGLAGLAGLVAFGILAAKNKLGPWLAPGHAPHEIYAETFAVWLVLFYGLQLAAGVAALLAPSATLLLAAVAFLASLSALAWPVARGIPFRTVCRDIGWGGGRAGALEPLFGLGGYLLALPMLGVGILATLALISLQSAFSAPEPPFVPVSGPAHPVVLDLATGDLWPRIQVLLLAAVVAPIVEETMFRGVLYRHLRDAGRRLGTWTSAALATALSSFLFAAVHPQGWVAIPALGALACSFCLLREWRGTVVPSMIAHGVSNALVTLGLIALLSS